MLKPINHCLFEIEQFVKTTKKEDEVGGWNVYVSKHPGISYVLAKSADNLKPLHVLKIEMDWASPVDRPLIANAIHRGIYGCDAVPEALEAEMVCKSKEDPDVEFIKRAVMQRQ